MCNARNNIKVSPLKMANGKWPRPVVDRSKDGLIITLTWRILIEILVHTKVMIEE